MVTDTNTMVVLGFESSWQQATRLAQCLSVPCSLIQCHRFPDGESRIKVPTGLPPTVLFVVSLDNPNAKLIELLLAVAASRRHGCQRAILVAPYLCYMRQDIEFEPGQAVSQLIIGDLLSSRLDGIITVDPHLHRINHLSESFTHCEAISLSAAGEIGRYLKPGADNRMLVGPDEESEQWVKTASDTSGLPYCIARKVRHGDRDVEVALPDENLSGKHAILLDDVISSGHTIKQAAQALMRAGCVQVDAVCTHGLFAPGAPEALTEAGITQVVSCNSIPHPSNQIDLSPLIKDAVIRLAY